MKIKINCTECGQEDLCYLITYSGKEEELCESCLEHKYPITSLGEWGGCAIGEINNGDQSTLEKHQPES